MEAIKKCLMGAWLCFFLLFDISILWSFDLIQITNTPGVDEKNHSIAVKGKSIYLAWEARSAIYFSKSKNEGINWSNPIEISKGFTPSIAVGQNNVVYIVWCKSDTVLSIYSNNDGESFLEYSKKLIGYGHCPAISIDKKNRIHIAWFHNTNPIYVRALHPDSLFSSPVAVDTAYYKWAESMDIVTDDEAQNICVGWSGPSPWYILANMSVSRDSGASFDKILSDSSCYGDYNLDLVVFSNDDICLVWEGDGYIVGYWYDVLFMKFEDWGQRRGPVIKLNERSAGWRGSRDPIFYPSIAADHYNKIYVAWCYPRSGYKDSTDIYYSISVNSGNSFKEAVGITDHLNPSSRKNPSIIVNDSDNINITWEDNLNGNYDIYCASRIFISGLNISGATQYYSNQTPVTNTTIALDGNQTITNTEGIFSFPAVLEGNYNLIPTKDGALGNSISAYDASMILRHVVGLLPLTPYQMIASDVSGNNDVSALDASYILRYVVGLITEFPVGDDWTFVPTSFAIESTNWATAPDSLRYEPLRSDTLNQDFVGIIYGDVSGNWPGSTDLCSSVITEINIGNIQHNNDGRWLVTLEIEFSDETYSSSFKVLYKNPDLKFTSISIDSSLVGKILFTSNASSGVINFAFASVQPLNEQVVKINMMAEERKPVIPYNSDFEFVDVFVDDKSATVTLIENQSDVQTPVDWYLNQNYPNPFNAETVIKYQLPEASKVKLSIYNLSGQEVIRLVDEKKIQGFHQVRWDGKDSRGRLVASGVYVYRISSEKYEMGRKLILLR